MVAAGGGSHLETIGQVTPEALFRVGDADGAAETLRGVALDEQRRRATGAALQAFQREALSITNHVEGLRRVYDAALLGERRRS